MQCLTDLLKRNVRRTPNEKSKQSYPHCQAYSCGIIVASNMLDNLQVVADHQEEHSSFMSLSQIQLRGAN